MSNLTLKVKLNFLAFIAVVGMLVFVLKIVSSELNEVNSLEKVEELVILSTKISALVHETQKERGMSAGYLGSKGAKFADVIAENISV